MKVKSECQVAQLCLTLSDPMVCSLPGSSAHGIFHARVLEWVLSPGDLPYPGIEPQSPSLEADALTSEPPAKFQWLFYLHFTLITRCHVGILAP